MCLENGLGNHACLEGHPSEKKLLRRDLIGFCLQITPTFRNNWFSNRRQAEFKDRSIFQAKINQSEEGVPHFIDFIWKRIPELFFLSPWGLENGSIFKFRLPMIWKSILSEIRGNLLTKTIEICYENFFLWWMTF